MAERAGYRVWPGRPSLVAVVAVAGVVCGGNCSIRGATRRRHAVAVCLMVQNPPLGGGVWPGERWPGGQATGRGQEGGPRAPGALLPGAAGEAAGWAVARRVVAGVRGGAWAGDPSLVAVVAVAGVVCGGNCSIRAATRRRHAVAMRLMVQNPPLGGGVWPGERWLGRQATGCGPAGEVAVGCGRVAAGCSWRGGPVGPWLGWRCVRCAC